MASGGRVKGAVVASESGGGVEETSRTEPSRQSRRGGDAGGTKRRKRSCQRDAGHVYRVTASRLRPQQTRLMWSVLR